MDFALSDLQTMLLDSAGRLLTSSSRVEAWRAQRESALGFDPARWAQFAELGWLALPIPEEAGGLGGTLEDVALLNIALGRALAGEPYVSNAVIAAHILSRASNAEAGSTLLAAIAGGEQRVVLAHGEVKADPLLAQRAGDGFVLDGAELLVLDGPSADQLIVTVRTEEEEGTALFLVPAKEVAAEHYPLIDGTRAADFHFDRVALGPEALIAGAGQGETLLAEALLRGQIAFMAQAVGSMEACLELCGNYARERRQFGAAIGSFQAIQHMLADMFVAAHQARSMLYYAIAGAQLPLAEAGAAVSAARIVVGEASQTVSRTGVQLHGGYGLTDEYAISHHFRRLMCLEKLHGDIATHVARLGEAIFRDRANHHDADVFAPRPCPV